MNRPTDSSEDHAARAPLAASVGTGSRRSGRVASPHASKFVVATSLLVGIAIIAVAVAIVTARKSNGDGPAPAWSLWKPADGGLQGARDIANHLAPYYRISGTQQLDAVTVLNVANPATVANSTTGTPPNQIQVALGNGSGSSTSSVQLLGGKTVAYQLCGLGTNTCAIGSGTASSARELLLRREALELALYTFRYVKGIDNVVAVLPPATTQETSTLSPTPPSATAKAASSPLDLAILFDRQQLQPWTSQPLANTLTSIPPSVPQLAEWVQTEEGALVDQLTARALYTNKFVHSPDGSFLLVLNPAPPQ